MQWVIMVLFAPVLLPVALAGWLWGLLTSRPYDLPHARRGWQLLLTWPGRMAWRWGMAHADLCLNYGIGVVILVSIVLIGRWGDSVHMPPRGVTVVAQAPFTCGPGDAGKMRLQTNGELEYCDGDARPQVTTQPLPDPSPHMTWRVTQSMCTGEEGGNRLTITADNQIVCATH